MSYREKIEEKYRGWGRYNRNLVIRENKWEPHYTITYWERYRNDNYYCWTKTKTKYFSSLKDIDNFMENLPYFIKSDEYI